MKQIEQQADSDGTTPIMQTLSHKDGKQKLVVLIQNEKISISNQKEKKNNRRNTKRSRDKILKKKRKCAKKAM